MERDKAMGDSDKGFEDGYYFHVVHMFCDFLTDAYYENDEDGRKWEHLMEVLKAKLPAGVFSEVFGDDFRRPQARVDTTPLDIPTFGLAREIPAEGHSTAEYKHTEEKTDQTSQGGPDCAH
jgi:hypothetical protein